MSRAQTASASLGDRLASRRQQRFVGREAELELFAAALDADEAPFAALYVHGPGGIGKSSLLDAFATRADQTDALVVRVDGQDILPTPPAMIETLCGPLDIPDEPTPITVSSDRRLILLVDAYERLAPVDDWVRTRLLPRLPATALTVIAGRTPPKPAWRVDPAWRDLLRVVSLRNLGPRECRRYLEISGVAPKLHKRLIEICHGHPLGLSLLADVVARGGDVPADPMAPDLVGTLLRQFVDAVPSGEQRSALEACALARVTTESLLRDALDVEAPHELFEWLRHLSFVEVTPDGVVPHELARDALDADLRWRDPETYKHVFRGVRDHVQRRLGRSRGTELQQAIFDLKFLFRNKRSVLSPVDWEAWGQHYPEPAQPKDRAVVLGLVAEAEGETSAAIAQRWWTQQPEGFFVLRDEQQAVRGVIGLLDLTAASEADRAADPGACAAWKHCQQHAAPRTGERVTQTRFIIDREVYQDPSPTMNAVPILTLQRYLEMPSLAWDFLTLVNPDPWDEYFALADLPRAVGADFDVGEQHFGLFAHHFRQVPVDALITLWTERALTQETAVSAPESSSVLVLSQEDFANTVRQALRDLHRPDLLARNALLRTRLLRERSGDATPDAAVLEQVLQEAVDSLRTDPRDDKRLRAVERTYVHQPSTQEAAARVLGLPFSTYRRHLTQGVERVVSWLWDQEVYSPGR